MCHKVPVERRRRRRRRRRGQRVEEQTEQSNSRYFPKQAMLPDPEGAQINDVSHNDLMMSRLRGRVLPV
jgi:hypothetical protein